jgi:hypothetical protein
MPCPFFARQTHYTSRYHRRAREQLGRAARRAAMSREAVELQLVNYYAREGYYHHLQVRAHHHQSRLSTPARNSLSVSLSRIENLRHL